ncbi:MAG: hypothetical protein ABW040_02345 [Microbacteriaceae bacterium]
MTSPDPVLRQPPRRDTRDAAASERTPLSSVVLGSVLAALIGAFVGAVTTFTHRQYVPFGIIIGLAIVVLVLVGFRLIFGSRIVAGAAALGILGVSALLSLPGAGGSVLVVDGTLGYVWAFGPALIALLVLAWPRVPTRRTA